MNKDELEARLESWLADTARPMPQELLDEIVAAVPRVDRPAFRAEFPSGRRWRLALGAVAAVLVVAVGLGSLLRVPFAPGASPTPSAPSSGPTAATPTASSSVAPSPGGSVEWHRNNYNAGEERLTCPEGTRTLSCTYQVGDATGSFIGQDVTEAWTCPAWFPKGICDNTRAVYRGVFVCCVSFQTQASAATPSAVNQELLVTDVAGQPVLQVYWVDRFVCPWYHTYAEALAADFNCVTAP
jgi:hypothetical protein